MKQEEAYVPFELGNGLHETIKFQHYATKHNKCIFFTFRQKQSLIIMWKHFECDSVCMVVLTIYIIIGTDVIAGSIDPAVPGAVEKTQVEKEEFHTLLK